MLSYYSNVIKDFSSKVHPLYQLLSNKTERYWSKECEVAFLWAKEVLLSKQVLIHCGCQWAWYRGGIKPSDGRWQ